ncbi:MAG: hypothetical protein J2P23_15520 [Microlunatus sp.]|nr:hypothetical protein [Microlunatus sp.]
MSESRGTVAYKDTVIDATDGQRMAGFWAAALGLSAEPNGDSGDAVLRDTVPEHTVWINQVPEPRTVKQRVHLDLHLGSIDELIKLGASVDQEFPHWTVLRDPEGGEVCGFVRDQDRLSTYRLYELNVDAADAEAGCRWWAERFGLQAQHDPENPWWWLEGGSLPWPMIFAPVPEPKTVKNRIHWDVWGDSAGLLDAGATLVRGRDDEISWDVLADPEGNEFCVFTR